MKALISRTASTPLSNVSDPVLQGLHGRTLAGAGFLAEPTTRRILILLNADGRQARVVGGAVRNVLLGLPASDIDICTTALPDEVMRRAKTAGIHAVPTGLEHGTVTLVIDRKPYEVTTLREDIGTDGRHATVRFGKSFRMDALRRDFTINALSVSADGTLHDYADGIADIKAGRVRFIGDADQRIREDYLRILRLFRFSAAYGGGVVDAEGLAAAQRNIAGLGQLSRERIGREMLKLLVQPGAGAVAATMGDAGFLEPVLTGPSDVARFTRLCAIEAALGAEPGALRRLAALALFSPEDASRLQDGLRLSKVEVDGLSAGLEPILLPTANSSAPRAEGGERAPAGETGTSESPLKEQLYRLGPTAYRAAVLAQWAQSGAAADDADWTFTFRLPERWTAPKFLIGGAQVMSAGVSKGPMVGRILAAVEDDWIAAGMPEDEAAQHALLRAVKEE